MAQDEGKDPTMATQAGLDELAQHVDAVSEAADERLKTIEGELPAIRERLDSVSDLAGATAEGVKGLIEPLQKRAGDGGYEQMLEDKIAVLEWAVENQGGINLREARRRILGDAAGATESSGTGEEPPDGPETPETGAGAAGGEPPAGG